jgi:hypothetical protein
MEGRKEKKVMEVREGRKAVYACIQVYRYTYI